MDRPDLVALGRNLSPQLQGQFITEADAWETDGPAIRLRYRLAFDHESKPLTLHLQRCWEPLASGGFSQELMVSSVPTGCQLRLQLLSKEIATRAQQSDDGRTLRLGDKLRAAASRAGNAMFSSDATAVVAAGR